jgi:hypothetical protein
VIHPRQDRLYGVDESLPLSQSTFNAHAILRTPLRGMVKGTLELLPVDL